jgi:hypothetical protein
MAFSSTGRLVLPREMYPSENKSRKDKVALRILGTYHRSNPRPHHSVFHLMVHTQTLSQISKLSLTCCLVVLITLYKYFPEFP